MTLDPRKWPAWYYGPAGEAAIFERPEDVPAGWADAPGKASPKSEAPKRRPRGK